MEVRVDNMRTRVLNITPKEYDWLDDYLSYEDKGFYKDKFGKAIHRVTTRHFLDRRNNTFPSGLLPLLVKAAESAGFSVEVLDGRPAPCAFDTAADVDWLHDYQFEAIYTAAKHTRGIIQIPTGGGKGEAVVGLGKALPCHWVFVVSDTLLVQDIAARWEKHTGDPAGFVYDGKVQPDPLKRFTACTLQMLSLGIRGRPATAKRKAIPPNPEILQLLGDAEGLMFDECHQAPAASFREVCDSMRRAYFRIGFSASPTDRGDKKSVLALATLGPVIYKIDEDFLIEQGVLAKAKIRVIPFKQDCARGCKGWQDAYSELIVGSKWRNDLIAKIAIKAAKPALVFVKEIEHGKALTKILTRFGVRCEFVWGDQNSHQREAAIKRLRFGETDAIVCSVVFQTGIDIPEIEAVINAAGTKTTIGALQRIGRGMRSNKGKKLTFEVWDVKDEGNGFMTRHARERLKAYRSRGHAVELVKASEL